MLSKCWLNKCTFFSWQEINLSEHLLGCLACKACEWAMGIGKKREELEICWTLSPEFYRIWCSEFRRETNLLVSDRTVLWDKNGLHFPQIPRPRPHVANGLPQYSIKKKKYHFISMWQKIKKKLNRYCSVLGSRMLFVAGIRGNAPRRDTADGTIIHFKCFLSGKKHQCKRMW